MGALPLHRTRARQNRWAETPYLTEDFDPIQLKGKKGRRNGTHLIGNYDIFDVNGELTWHDYWWRAGHYVEIVTEGDVHYEAHFHRTGYPYPVYKGDSKLCRMAYETLQACSHETYMDCPYYEQLMYIGDSRLEALCTYEITDDHRASGKSSAPPVAFTVAGRALRSQYPSKSMQVIPSFMLVYLLMFHDYYRIHGRDELVEELLPRVGGFLIICWHTEKTGFSPCPAGTSSTGARHGIRGRLPAGNRTAF